MEPVDHNEQAQKLRHLLIVVLGLFAILFLRLFYLQVTTSADYERESEENRYARKRIKAHRGLILARDGQILASNAPFYTVAINRCSSQDFAAAVAALKEATGATITQKYNKKGPWPIHLKRDVDFRTVSIVEERLKDDWPLDILIQMKRAYPMNNLAAHLLGYMGEKSAEDVRRLKTKVYARGDYFGKTGIEMFYEDHLRGEDGIRVVEVDAKGRERRQISEHLQTARSGRDLHLTIDRRVQRRAEEALPDSLGGCVVALDPNSGAILALASRPTFDPNIFVSFQQQEERQRVLQRLDKPLLNRAISGTYPPGSTLKMVAAIAALETGISDTLSTFEACAGSLQVGETVFRCFKRDGHGELNLMQALETSCNIYFQHLAQIMSIETWGDYAARFGFGQVTGIDMEPREEKGGLPSRQFYVETEGWTQGHLLNLVIGQGAILVTPMQMARYVAALGNGGYLVTPHLYKVPPSPQPIEDISPATLDIVKQAMRRVVYGEHGTGHRVQITGIEVAGKSGTAQGPKEEDDAWFVAFAPYEEPTIAVAVVVEGGGGGGSVAGPIARQVIEAYFDIDSATATVPPPDSSTELATYATAARN